MPTYIYQTIPEKEGDEVEEFEFVQSMKDAPLTVHPDNGKPIRRVITGGLGFSTSGKIDPFSEQQFRERTSGKGDTLGALWDRSKELSQMRAEKNGGVDPVKKKYFDDYKKRKRGTPHTAELVEEHKKAKKELDEGVKKIAKEMGIHD